ncbi:MAG: acyl-CoA dehydrogenase [Dehalococcoidia bacterium]|nr:acyl-CoA dehydrogenase [Dehalococcoidia bacterium]
MDLALTETQVMLQNSAKEFLSAELPKHRVREIDDSETGFDRELWRKMCDLGWASIVIPEQYGGLGSGFTDMAVIFEQLGYNAYGGPLLDSAVLSAQLIAEAGSEAQKKAFLPAIAEGQQIFTVALTEPEYGWGADRVKMKATRQGDHWVLNGTKLFIPWAHIADRIIVIARTSEGRTPEDGITAFVVDRTSPGVSTRLHYGWIGDKLNEVNFSNVRVPAENVLGAVGHAWAPVEHARDRATAVLSVYMAGGAQKAYEMCRDYSTTRIAFGVPIGTFQRVQDFVIVALTEADASKWTAYEALWRLDSGQKDTAVGISMAKAVASDGFSKACDASHHVHAGIGVDLDFGLTNYTVRARTFQQYLGDSIFHKARMAKLMNL